MRLTLGSPPLRARRRWWVVSLLFGFYVSNTLSLTFGALGVNDVVAGIVCLVGHEFITKEHYSREPRCAPRARARRVGSSSVWLQGTRLGANR